MVSLRRHRRFALTWALLTMAMLVLSSVPVLAQAGPGDGLQRDDPMPQRADPLARKIEAEVLQQLDRSGTTSFWVVMAEKADLSQASGLNWSDRGWFVYERLRETAARSQAPVIRQLQEMGVELRVLLDRQHHPGERR